MRSGGAIILIAVGLFVGYLAVQNRLGCLKINWDCVSGKTQP
jgi:hypothetical protein